MKKALLIICGVSFMLAGCEEAKERREERREERAMEKPAGAPEAGTKPVEQR